MLKNRLYGIFLLVIMITCIFGETNSLKVDIYNGFKRVKYSTSLFIDNNNWTKYKVDISKYDLDSVTEVQFDLYGCIVFIDSIILIGVNDTLIIEDFEDYNLGDLGYTPLSDRAWGIGFCIPDPTWRCLIIEDNSKCLEIGSACNFRAFFEFILPPDSTGSFISDYQDWSGYQTFSLSVKRKESTRIKNNHKKTKNILHVYQNHVNKTVYMDLPALSKHLDILVFNPSGKLVYQIHDISTKTLIWHPDGLTQGVYIINAATGDKNYSSVLLLK